MDTHELLCPSLYGSTKASEIDLWTLKFLSSLVFSQCISEQSFKTSINHLLDTR